MSPSDIRALAPEDCDYVSSVVDDWWGGRAVRANVPRLFFEHFTTTSFAVGPVGRPRAFLIGFVSPSQPHLAYIHFVGVDPAARMHGLGRRLYQRFFGLAASLGCTEVQCITSPVNTGSIAFHRSMGFALLDGDAEVGGIPVRLHHAGEGQHRVRFRRLLRGGQGEGQGRAS